MGIPASNDIFQNVALLAIINDKAVKNSSLFENKSMQQWTIFKGIF